MLGPPAMRPTLIGVSRHPFRGAPSSALAMLVLPWCTGCHVGRWSPGIGDPTIMGWVTVFLYFLTSYLCLKCVGIEKSGPRRALRDVIPAWYRVTRKHWPALPPRVRRANIWMVIAGLYFCLGINKQLDLQSAVTEMGRIVARRGNWYDARGSLQALFIGVVLVLAVISTFKLIAFAKDEAVHFVLPFIGVVVTVTFILVRATSFHDMDLFIGAELLGIRTNWLLEIGGISLVMGGAWLRLAQGSRALER